MAFQPRPPAPHIVVEHMQPSLRSGRVSDLRGEIAPRPGHKNMPYSPRQAMRTTLENKLGELSTTTQDFQARRAQKDLHTESFRDATMSLVASDRGMQDRVEQFNHELGVVASDIGDLKKTDESDNINFEEMILGRLALLEEQIMMGKNHRRAQVADMAARIDDLEARQKAMLDTTGAQRREVEDMVHCDLANALKEVDALAEQHQKAKMRALAGRGVGESAVVTPPINSPRRKKMTLESQKIPTPNNSQDRTHMAADQIKYAFYL